MLYKQALHGVSEESLLRGEGGQKLQDVVLDIATVANLHLTHVSCGG